MSSGTLILTHSPSHDPTCCTQQEWDGHQHTWEEWRASPCGKKRPVSFLYNFPLNILNQFIETNDIPDFYDWKSPFLLVIYIYNSHEIHFLWVKSCKFPHVSWYLLLKSRWHLHEGEPLATPPGREGFGVQVGPLAEISSSSCLISIWFWENYRFCLAILLIFFGNFVWNLLILLGSVGFLVNRNCSVQCISDLVLELVAVERSPLSAFKHCAVILVESWNVCDIHHWVISACKSQGLLFAVLPFLHVCWFGHPGVEQITLPFLSTTGYY